MLCSAASSEEGELVRVLLLPSASDFHSMLRSDSCSCLSSPPSGSSSTTRPSFRCRISYIYKQIENMGNAMVKIVNTAAKTVMIVTIVRLCELVKVVIVIGTYN